MAHGWEFAAAAIGAGLIVIVLAALAGIAVAAELFGGGWVWPHGTDAITRAVNGILTGQPGRGLPRADAAHVANAWATYLCIALCELLLISAATAGGLTIARHLRDDGMATRHDAERALGMSELRSARAIIRPDLYGLKVGSPEVHDADMCGPAMSRPFLRDRRWNWRSLHRSKET